MAHQRQFIGAWVGGITILGLLNNVLMIYISLQFSQQSDGSSSPFFRKSLPKVQGIAVWTEEVELGVAALSRLVFFLLPW